MLRALALDDLGSRQEALSTLEGAVDRAAPEGSVRPFLDYGRRVRELLGELARRPGGGEFAETLCAAFDRGENRHGRRASDAFRAGDLLTLRELETLELLAWRMTNKEIAARLSVSVAAIKKRLESIYSKLGVNDRRTAVAEAVSRGLIDSPAR